jgi:hypothetical protein
LYGVLAATQHSGLLPIRITGSNDFTAPYGMLG